eukprot:3936875-Rhodomonas_salina.3
MQKHNSEEIGWQMAGVGVMEEIKHSKQLDKQTNKKKKTIKQLQNDLKLLAGRWRAWWKSVAATRACTRSSRRKKGPRRREAASWGGSSCAHCRSAAVYRGSAVYYGGSASIYGGSSAVHG